jgi:DNA damage-inducible protein 1
MLYVPVLVNGHPVKAFVDSGAQTTIMSPSCAEACGIDHLIDDRYSGVARGVGTAKIIGKVHNAKIQVGDAELDCAFTVMEGKDVDLLFGLDMLKRHQACIDLQANVLRFPHTQIEFLGESDIPKREEVKMLDEPTVEGPNGTEIGTQSGTIRPKGTAAAAHETLEKAKSAGEPSSSQLASASTAASASAPAPAAQQPAAGASRYSEQTITQLMNLGASREEAIGALDAAGGNVEYAAGMLF